MFPAGFLSSIRPAMGFEEESFVEAHRLGQPPVSIRVNSEKLGPPGIEGMPFEGGEKVPWCASGYYLPERPVFTLDPLLHAGAYYVQEASSMFIEQAVKEVCRNIQVRRAIDLCAAPGGKSTHLLSLLPPESILVSNEVIQPRTAILRENMIKWGSTNCMVTQNDPADFGKLGPSFDLMVVDAPCSGSGLFRRDPAAMTEWSTHAVELCSQRQQRILADALPALCPGGYLLYATCSYSPAEDEKIVDWLATDFSMEGVELDWADGNKGVVAGFSAMAKLPCYRFYPGKVKGEGFFMALLKKGGEEEQIFRKPAKQKAPDEKLPNAVHSWIKEPDRFKIFRHKENIYMMPPVVFESFQQWRPLLNIRKAGVKLAEEAHGTFNPSHDIALCTQLKMDSFNNFEADKATAIAYLRKQDFALPDNIPKGWVLICFEALPLGWIKNMGNRSNNYYPKEWRIRMQSNG